MSKFEVPSATQKREKPFFPTGRLFPAGRKFSQCTEMLSHLEHNFLWEETLFRWGKITSCS
jgi:hypothetical protein